MSVRVSHRSTDFTSNSAKFTTFTSDYWEIQDGHLTIGDSEETPEASFAPGNWFSVVSEDYQKAESEEDS
jgi:hypothetical protein